MLQFGLLTSPIQKDEHARNAEKFGKGMMILGRSCRTEMARAHCTYKCSPRKKPADPLTYLASFVVAKKSGEPTEFDEAEKLLGQLGEVARVEHLPEDVQVAHGVSQAVLVTYKMYDNKRDPVRVRAPQTSSSFHSLALTYTQVFRPRSKFPRNAKRSKATHRFQGFWLPWNKVEWQARANGQL